MYQARGHGLRIHLEASGKVQQFVVPDRIEALFRAYFNMEAPAALSSLKVLTPGDFPVVRRKAEVTGQLDDVDALVAILKAECDAKPNQTKGIGITAAA